MFTIIGGDGKEYGPVSAAQIRSWIAAGRANLDTQAKAVGTDEWRRLGDFAEFAPRSEPAYQPDVPGDAAAAVVVAESDLADRESRLFARMVDWSLKILCMLPGSLMLGVAGVRAIIEATRSGDFNFNGIDLERLAPGAAALLFGAGVLWLVQVILLSTRGQTIGKIMLNIRVVRLDGARAGFGRAWFLREFVPSLLGFIPIIGPLLLSPVFFIADCCFIFRDDRRCIHDLLANTRVVKALKVQKLESETQSSDRQTS